MRTEAIEKEANLYDEKDGCYIHVELAPGSDNYAQIMTGGEAKIAQAIYNLIGELCTTYKRDPKKLLKFYMKAMKKIGIHEAYSPGEEA